MLNVVDYITLTQVCKAFFYQLSFYLRGVTISVGNNNFMPHGRYGRVENWRPYLEPLLHFSMHASTADYSGHRVSSSPSSNRTFSFPEYGFPIIFFQGRSQSMERW
jgi:hypothetical protein